MKILFIIVIFMSTLLLSDTDINIDSYIERIKQASPENRVKLMNEFKQKVAQMNKEERLKSIQQIQLKMKVDSEPTNHTNMPGQHITELNKYPKTSQKKVEIPISQPHAQKNTMQNKDHR